MKVWVNGTFDVLHIGHIRLLEYAKKYGEVRVGIDSDERVREKKGDSRPYNTLSDRVEFITSLKYVDSVVTFNSDEELIERIKDWDPDIMVIGDDYQNKEIIGSEFIERVIFFQKIENKSTSSILKYDKDISNR